MKKDSKNLHELIDAGLSLIPIKEGEKIPHPSCLDSNKKHNLLYTQSTREELDHWINSGVTSWAIAGGKVSGNLVTLDFDEKNYPGLYELWYAKLSDDQKRIVDSCYKNSTRNKGTHLRYRTETPQPSIKLASKINLKK
ncbi:MAG: bifunctional DNA primase/polymerase [bacterium]